jgi:nucleoside-diphosphate-sugar epimerase
MEDLSANEAASGLDVLILGGCGFVGRHLVALLVKEAPEVRIRVVDKLLPAMAFLAPDHKAAFESPAVEYKQANLNSQAGLEKAFEGRAFRYVFNLTYDAVTYGQTDEVYKQIVLDVSTRAGMLAAQRGVARFVELSTGQVYEPSEKATTEATGKLKPWTKQATFKLRAEATLRDVPNLPLTVLRCATIYGPGDVHGLSPRVLCAAVYRHLGEKMKFAWDGKLRCNTVHVRDVAAACWHVARLEATSAPAYNLADQSDSSQSSLASVLEQVFNIQTGFAGVVASSAMRAFGVKRVADDYNEKHMSAWQDMCKAAGIHSTALTPHIDAELLSHNHLAISGASIEATGFAYKYPQLTADSLREQVETYVTQQLMPPPG